MATEQSQFSKSSKKQLAFILEKLVDEEFTIGNPYGGDFEDDYKILENVSKYFNITPTVEDVEFFAKLLEINEEIIADLFANNKEQIKNRELIEQLIIPVAKTYNLEYQVNGSCSYNEYLQQEFDSYDEDWIADHAHQREMDGSWYSYDGNERKPTDYHDHNQNDIDFGEVYEVYVDSDGYKLRRESILGKLVVENTKDVVNSLDKKTLLELRRIIDSKLRLL